VRGAREAVVLHAEQPGPRSGPPGGDLESGLQGDTKEIPRRYPGDTPVIEYDNLI